MTAKVAAYRAPVDAFAKEVIGEAAVDLTRGSGGDSALGNLICDVMLAAGAAAEGAVACLQNSGGIRANIPKGTVLWETAYNVLPFANTLVILTVTGAELRAALDNGLSGAAGPDGAPRSGGAFPQVAGMTVRWAPPGNDAGAPSQGYARSVRIGGAEVEDAKTYRIVTNSFMAGGGDFYTVLRDACARPSSRCIDTGLLPLDLLVSEFKARSPVARTVEGRIVRSP